jgi:hypothetical protein
MISLNTWNTLYEGKYGDQELNILYKEDIFVSFLRLRDKTNALIQVYKVFVVKGDVETFASTLPYPAIVYHKHLTNDENYKYFLIHTETEYVDINTLSYHVDKKITELNKMISSVISVIKSYDIKLISLKMAGEKNNNYFFSDPDVLKILTNMPLVLDFKSSSPLDKLILGKKKDVTITTSLSNLKHVSIFGKDLDERLFASKIICENYLLSSKTIIVFDRLNNFLSLGYPQQNTDIFDKFKIDMDPFGFPIKKINYKEIKMPLYKVPLNAFLDIFSFKGVLGKIISQVYDKEVYTITDLIKKIENIPESKEINSFEKTRIVSRLLILKKKYDSFFGKTNFSKIFRQRYKNIGSVKIIDIDKDDVFLTYFILNFLDQLSLTIREEILLVFPEIPFVFNNLYVGDLLFEKITENTLFSSLFTSKYENDFIKENFSSVKLVSVNGNDSVIYYPNRDPLRLYLRPTFSSSIIKYNY